MSSTEATEKLSIKDLYKEGDFIDAKDNQADWRVGYIVAKNENIQSFKVRFDGWSSKYDEVHPEKLSIISSTPSSSSPSGRSSLATLVRSKTLHFEKDGHSRLRRQKRYEWLYKENKAVAKFQGEP